MAGITELRASGSMLAVLQGGEVAHEVAIGDFVGALTDAADRAPSFGLLPRGVRMLHERGNSVGLVVEVPPHTRTVRWVADNSSRPYGRHARYEVHRIGFPYVVLLLVLARSGRPTGWQQLFYRTAPLDRDQKLLLPNLYNVAQGYGQRCWVCLANLPDRPKLSFSGWVDAIVDHVFTAAWNRSSEVHEGNSYFSKMRELDPRLKTVRDWHDATVGNPLFPLEVAWKPAGTTAGRELLRMLDHVAPRRVPTRAEDLAGIVARVRGEASA